MPTKKVFKKKSSKKVKFVKKVKSQAPRLKNIVNFGVAFPKKAMMTHKYHDTTALTIAAGGGVQTNYTFSANGMYDPNITGTGHQPFCFDQMAALYDHYVVIGSKITVKFAQYSTANNIMYVSLFNNDDTTVTPSFDALAEQGTSKFTQLGVGTSDIKTLTSKYSAKKYFGGSVLSNNVLQGSSAANPTEASNYTISLYSPTGGGGTVQIEVFIEYIAIWTELKDIASS